MTLEVLWHPPLLAHKASPSTLALLLTVPVTRLSHHCPLPGNSLSEQIKFAGPPPWLSRSLGGEI